MNTAAGMSPYFADLSRLPLLSASEELDLARKARDGDADARRRLIEGNLRLVVQLAKRFHAGALPFHDLVAEGNVGLLLAADRFDPERGFRFSTYAAWWIRQCIGKALQGSSHIVHFGSAQVTAVRLLNRKRRELENELHRDPTADELRTAVGVSNERFATTTRASTLMATEWCVADSTCAVATSDAEPLEATSERDAIESVCDRLNTFDSRTRQIVRWRFGLDGNEPMTLRQIGVKLSLTRERVRQILKSAMASLR